MTINLTRQLTLLFRNALLVPQTYREGPSTTSDDPTWAFYAYTVDPECIMLLHMTRTLVNQYFPDYDFNNPGTTGFYVSGTGYFDVMNSFVRQNYPQSSSLSVRFRELHSIVPNVEIPHRFREPPIITPPSPVHLPSIRQITNLNNNNNNNNNDNRASVPLPSHIPAEPSTTAGRKKKGGPKATAATTKRIESKVRKSPSTRNRKKSISGSTKKKSGVKLRKRENIRSGLRTCKEVNYKV